MSRAALLVLGAFAALAGCTECPYSVDSIGGGATVALSLRVEDAARAEEALDAMGYEAVRDGLLVRGEREGLLVQVGPNGNGTSVSVWDEMDRDFRSHRATLRFVEENRAQVEARVNATLADFLGRTGWTASGTEPVDGAISVC